MSLKDIIMNSAMAISLVCLINFTTPKKAETQITDSIGLSSSETKKLITGGDIFGNLYEYIYKKNFRYFVKDGLFQICEVKYSTTRDGFPNMLAYFKIERPIFDENGIPRSSIIERIPHSLFYMPNENSIEMFYYDPEKGKIIIQIWDWTKSPPTLSKEYTMELDK